MIRTTRAGLVLLTVLTIAAAARPAQCQTGEKLSIRGFGGWALGYSGNDNAYVDVANNDVKVDNYDFALNLLARPADNITIHAQPSWQARSQGGNDVRLDLAYAEWEFVPRLKVEAGKIKNPIGLYTDIYKVGTLRPFYLLPAAMYRNVPQSYIGAGLSGRKPIGSWELEGHVLGGKMEFEPSVTDTPIAVDPTTGIPVFASLPTAWEGRDFVGGGAVLSLPDKGLKIGAQVFSLKVFASVLDQPMARIGDDRTRAFSGSVEYLNDRWSLRGEFLTARKPTDFDTGYVEAAYRLDEHWQLATQFDFLRRVAPDAVVEQLGDHQSVSVGLNYWVVRPDLVWKLSYSRVTENYLARTEDAVNDALAGRLAKDTDVVIFGVQFSF